MLEITSISNSTIKEVVKLQQKKYRTQSGLFLLEGHKPIQEAFLQNIEIDAVYVTKENLSKYEFIKDKCVLVSNSIIEKISTTDSAPDAVAVAKQKLFEISNIKTKTRIALIENIKDAGNLGTLIRSATAFSIEAIILCGDTIDLYNPKVVRSTVGSLFKLPIIKMNLNDTKKIFENHNFIATVVNHRDIVTPETIDYKKPFIIMLGSEANGLTSEAINLSNIKTTIPISKNTESLNLSVAGSILFYISSNC